jgi:putative flippase GtrA
MALTSKLFFQLMRFGIVGLTAAAVHFSVVVLLVELNLLQPLYANVIAFLISFNISYSGHRYWTFRGTVTQHRTAFPKLLLLQTSNLIANESLFYISLTFLKLPYPVALLLVLVTLPIITFTVSKFWVFR